MKISKYEQEIVVNCNRGESVASVYSSMPHVTRALKKNKNYKLISDDGVGVFFECDVGFILSGLMRKGRKGQKQNPEILRRMMEGKKKSG